MAGAHPPPERIAVVFHAPRTGSSVLAAMLDQHPELTWKGELLTRMLRGRERGLGPLAKGRDPIEALLRRCRRAETRLAGFEVIPADLAEIGVAPAAFVEALAGSGPPCSFGLLRRRNLLRGIVSTLAAEATGRWHLAPGEQPPRASVHLDPAAVRAGRLEGSLVGVLERVERDNAAIARALGGRESLELVYEDDVAPDPAIGYARLCRFLGVEPGRAEVRHARTNPWPVRALLADPRAVERALRGTRFAWMLEG